MVLISWLKGLGLLYGFYQVNRPFWKSIFKIFFLTFIAPSTATSTTGSNLNVNSIKENVNTIGGFSHITSASNTGPTVSKMTDIPANYGNFDRVIEPFSSDSAQAKVVKWKSRKTGLSVVWGDVDGPIINGNFVVPTETFDDSGIPHTLEHLVLFASKKYPYNGTLQTLANRSFSYGVYAYTTLTYTVYTLMTAGDEGFLRLIPVFNPTLTPEAFATEVYHINGEGKDAGVVYSEVQGTENTRSDLMALAQKRELYPEGNAYRSQFGGLLERIRVLTVDESKSVFAQLFLEIARLILCIPFFIYFKVKNYHNQNYRPHNLQLIVTGKLDPTNLLKVLQDEVEPVITPKQYNIPNNWKRPFLETPSKGGPVLDQSKTRIVELPGNDESPGEVSISWVGPDTREHLTKAALSILQIYLTESEVSPLSKRFIEIASPLCTDITFFHSDGEKIVVTAYLSSVPNANLLTIGDALRGAIAEEAEEIHMDRLKDVIEREILQISNAMEADPHGFLPQFAISSFLYGEDRDLVSALTMEVQRYKELATWSAKEWSAIFKRWLTESPSLTVIGKSSVKLADKLNSDLDKRHEEIRRNYKPEGLNELAQKLEAARKSNDHSIPYDLLSRFPIPSINNLKWINVEIAHGHQKYVSHLQSIIDKKDPIFLPYFVQFHHIESNFLSIYITLSPADLPGELFPFISIYLRSFFSLSIKCKDGKEMTSEEVVSQLNKDAIQYDIGIGGTINQTVLLSMKVEKSKYARAVVWLRDLLWESVFDSERLRVITNKALQELPRLKREGAYVAKTLLDDMLYSPDLAPHSALSVFRKEKDYQMLLKELESNPKSVIEKMKQLRSRLLRVSSMRISVTGNIRALEEPKATWVKNFKKLEREPLLQPLMSNEVLRREAIEPRKKAIVMSMGSIQSSHAFHFAKGPQGFNHSERAACIVAAEVLNLPDRFILKAIRQTGLAYAASIFFEPETGHVVFEVGPSADSINAIEECAKLINDLASETSKIDEATLETAKSVLAHSVVSGLGTGALVADEIFKNALIGLPPEFPRELLQKIMDVSVEDVIHVIRTYIVHLFEPARSSATVTCPKSEANQIARHLSSKGYELRTIPQRLWGMQARISSNQQDRRQESADQEVSKPTINDKNIPSSRKRNPKRMELLAFYSC
ncbi:hypothetical protein O181_052479 [Austropuccinia psidii MF-1]|uniref:Peptidase M16 C-terminal domain-containing protein n=1 Tax=Austropuccinia psidii MF-1 TaxID=1389203 RepID=A0A9Q3E0Q6_9BASI|nr:hypothetical protein [Austropuccinia psidii MF-1]